MEEKFTWFEIVGTEWREQYDREWGFGLVLVASDDYWVLEIRQSKHGWFVTNRVESRPASKLKKTKYTLSGLDISVMESPL